MHCGFTLCTGSLGGLYSNSPHLLMEEFADRVYFAHFRNTVFDADHESFRESDSHLCGHTDMAYAMQCLINEENRRKAEGLENWRIPVRPDHGKLMDIDLEKKCYAGYSYGGRVIGLAELRGLAMGLQSFRPLVGKNALVTGAARGSLLRHGPRPAEGRGQGGPAGPHPFQAGRTSAEAG